MQASNAQWYIADPVHQMVELTDYKTCLKPLLSAPPLQRLRRITQLGLASYVFPGAVHTRFSHSLGAAHLAVRIAEVLGDAIPTDNARTVVCAALLHDVGTPGGSMARF